VAASYCGGRDGEILVAPRTLASLNHRPNGALDSLLYAFATSQSPLRAELAGCYAGLVMNALERSRQVTGEDVMGMQQLFADHHQGFSQGLRWRIHDCYNLAFTAPDGFTSNSTPTTARWAVLTTGAPPGVPVLRPFILLFFMFCVIF
jgi:hypothetical protein